MGEGLKKNEDSVTIELIIALPKPPNFLRLSSTQKVTIPVADLSNKEIELVAEALADQFRRHAYAKRNEPRGA